MRLVSLDVFRGITIALMILVNQAGVADNVYPALDHAPWNGWTPTDLVFPFFLFAVGLAMSYSLKPDYLKIAKRAAVLFAFGLLINGFYNYDLSTIRLMGVLQRIALCYLLTALIALKLPVRAQLAVGAAILLGYWAGMSAWPLTREGNLGALIDRSLIPAAHLYRGDGWNNLGDPEGLFSTLPAVVSTLIGYWTGLFVRARKPDSRVSMDLVLAGLAAVAAGKVWGWAFPINKKLWTSSYALFMGGLALLLFSACYELIEIRGRRAWAKPFEDFGANSLTIFLGSVLLIKMLVKFHAGSGTAAPSLFDWLNNTLFVPWLGPLNGPTAIAVLSVGLWWCVARAMNRRALKLRA